MPLKINIWRVLGLLAIIAFAVLFSVVGVLPPGIVNMTVANYSVKKTLIKAKKFIYKAETDALFAYLEREFIWFSLRPDYESMKDYINGEFNYIKNPPKQALSFSAREWTPM